MSEPFSALPPRPSLEQLRKRARELLRLLRDGSVAALQRLSDVRGKAEADERSPQLADAQFVIAREHGFDSWPKLVSHIEAGDSQGFAFYDTLATEIADAYTTPDIAGIRNINWKYGTSFYWDRDPETMQKRLPTWFASASRSRAEAITDARYLVARAIGYDDWSALSASLAGAPHIAGRAAPYFDIDEATHTIHVRGPLSDRHWDNVVAAMKQHGVTAVRAGGMTDEALRKIASLGTITRLDSESGGITDHGMQVLANLPHLEHLNCGGPASIITDKGLAVVEHLKELREFQMSWASRITDTGAANLRFCDHLENVNLMGTHTGDGVIRALAGKTKLRHFNTGAMVSDAGIPHLHDLPAFKSWQGEKIGYESVDADEKPNRLMLDGPFTNAGFAQAAGLDGLFGLSFFWHVTQLTSAAFHALPDMANLGLFGAEGQLCDDRAMQFIGRIPRLKTLMAQGTVAGDVGFEALSASQTLESIWGRESHNLGSRGFMALATMPSLAKMALSLAKIDDSALAHLPQFPALREITPMDVADDAFRHIGECANLHRLVCMYCRATGDVATEHIAKLRKLTSYYAGATQITDRSCEILGTMDSLEKIEFWETVRITAGGMPYLTRLPRLRVIEVGGLPNVPRSAMNVFPKNVKVNWG